MPHATVNLAMEAVKYYLDCGEFMTRPEKLSKEFLEKSAVFVSIKKNKELRGCIGSITPKTTNLGNEIILYSVKAATEDPRFPPISKMEFVSNLNFSVDVLTPLQIIKDFSKHDPKIHGLFIKSESKSGVLLPNLEGVSTKKEQLEICKNKAGIKKIDNIEMYRFKVARYY